MNVRVRSVIAIILTLFASIGFAEDGPPPDVAVFSQQELDQMLAPIALYPDTLLSQILMASTYPLEVVEAARWSRANPGLKGEQAVRAVEERNWDPSVKSLAAFPQLITMMDEKLEWTERLGDAFLAQPSQVMDSVQQLRQRAYAAGTLRSTDAYRVQQRDRIIVIESPRPEVVYVPYYDPYVVYGGWHWSAYPPVYWAPWSGYVYRAGFVGFRWGLGVHIGHGFFFGTFDWPHRHVKIVNVNTFYYPRVVHRTVAHHHVWRHNPHHRRGVHYKHPHVQHRYVRVNAPQVRREYPQHTRPSHEVRREWSRRAHHDGHDRSMRLDHARSVVPGQRLSGVGLKNQHDAHGRSPIQNRMPLEPRAPAIQRSNGNQADVRQHHRGGGSVTHDDGRQHRSRDDSRRGLAGAHTGGLNRSGGMVQPPSRGNGSEFQAGAHDNNGVRRN